MGKSDIKQTLSDLADLDPIQLDLISYYIEDNFCPKESDGMRAAYAPIGSLIIPPDKVEALKSIVRFASHISNEECVIWKMSDLKKRLEKLNLEEILNPKIDGKFADGGIEK